MIGYFLAIIPIYFLLYLPIHQLLYGPSSLTSPHHALPFNESFIAPEVAEGICAAHPYEMLILSREPLVIYLPGFISATEAEHLIEIGKDHLSTSSVSTGPTSTTDPTIRLSLIAPLNSSDTTVSCIAQRARALQGYRPRLIIEQLKLQKYGPGGHYVPHYDWAGAGHVDRVSSFMVYVRADCQGGGTGFPRLRHPGPGRWCAFLECPRAEDEDGGEISGTEGVVFKPIVGNAIYWENLRADGTGYPETWHAGLPVESGEKFGLNIWSWYQF